MKLEPIVNSMMLNVQNSHLSGIQWWFSGLLEHRIRNILVSFSVAVKKYFGKSNFKETSLSSQGSML